MAKFEMDTEFIRKLAKLLEETNLGEIEMAEGDRRIRVARPKIVAATMAAAAPAPLAQASHPTAIPAATPAARRRAIRSVATRDTGSKWRNWTWSTSAQASRPSESSATADSTTFWTVGRSYVASGTVARLATWPSRCACLSTSNGDAFSAITSSAPAS